MRQWVTPRSLLLHLCFIVIAGGCLIAAWWQVHRAMEGNTLSYLYSVEWPAFAVVAGIGWWQMFHDTPEDIAARHAFHHKMRAASAEVVARTLPRSARAITVGSEEKDGRVLNPASPARPAIGTGAFGAGTDLAPRGAEVAKVEEPDLETLLLEADEASDEPTDPLVAYNRYLATLALHGKPKTWRNPRGL